jgi:RING-type zinc-finger
MQFDELTCTLCNEMFEGVGEMIPRLLPECGHTFCTKCLNDLLASENSTFVCPEDK